MQHTKPEAGMWTIQLLHEFSSNVSEAAKMKIAVEGSKPEVEFQSISRLSKQLQSSTVRKRSTKSKRRDNISLLINSEYASWHILLSD